MTKEPIMIDGVDVSGCEFYNKVIGEDAYCNIDEEHLCTCISYDNCYYKQLKRLENEYECFAVKYTDMEIALKHKEQECEELKEELEAVYDDCKGCSTCNEALYNANLYAKDYRKLKQALAEIKQLTTEAKTKQFVDMEDFWEQILQKCEVLDD